MRINHNLMAMNTHRMLGINQAGTTKSIEKLSSGYRINRAGDDAAGLAISEKMRAQVRGLNQASRNSQDGISLIQTAEGALNETHDILQRMRELAVQSASDTNVDVDREAIQEEVDALATEITRISNNTEFNERKLLDGGLETGAIGELTFQIGANATQSMDLGIGAMDAKTLGIGADGVDVENATDISSAAIASGATGTSLIDGASLTIGVAANGSASTGTITVGTVAVTTVDNTEFYNDYTVEVLAGGNDTIVVNHTAKTIVIDGTATDATADLAGFTQSEVGTDASGLTGGFTFTATSLVAGGPTSIAGGVGDFDITVTDAASNTQTISVATDQTGVEFDSTELSGLQLTLDGTISGADTASVNVNIAAAATFSGGELASAATAGAGIDISTQTAADTAITTINTAITTVSTQRAKLGAVQNRLEHTIKNLDTSSENLQASESRIRDVDMAKEMMEFTKNNILQQAAQSMLAQANQQPQGVLQLLR
ncbi:flagellin [Clostridiaceae bacterium HSG29]|nr:flagellin [Clostridiaceae bacterium HSG29]